MAKDEYGNKKQSIFADKISCFNLLLLLLILAAGAAIRFHRLTRQSYWGDEIFTMFDSNPHLSWNHFLHSITYVEIVHPPLYFALERFSLSLFGYNDWVGRATSAAQGLLSIWAIFLLGKEIKNQRLGIIAAGLMCVNFFNIFYSQEARMYALLCLFTTLSYLFFIKVVKYLRSVDALLFAIFSACTVYTHYFGFLVIVSELAMSLLFLAQEQQGKRSRLLRLLFLANFIVAICFCPWASHLNFTSGLHSFWIAPLKWNFFIYFFNEYFGNSAVISLVAAILLFCFLVHVCYRLTGFKNLRNNPMHLGFVFAVVSIIVSLGIPYLRSVLVVPMLVSRYSIIVLPPLIIAIACGIEAIPYNVARYAILAAFMAYSVFFLVFEKQYYRHPLKAQVRELAAVISLNNDKTPVVEDKSPELLTWYLKNIPPGRKFYTGNKNHIVDSILQQKEEKYKLDSFWIVGNVDAPLTPQKQKDLDTAYLLAQENDFYGTWAQLYIKEKSIVKSLDYTSFDSSIIYSANIVPIWGNNDVAAKPFTLTKGNYMISALTMGSAVRDTFAHNTIFINKVKIGSFFSGEYFTLHQFPFSLQADTVITVSVDMDNDDHDTEHDRNSFIRKIYILKQ